MTQEIKETQEKILKIEMAFDADAAKVINEMKNEARTESTEQLITDALRVYSWYLENRKHGLYTKRDEELVKLDLQL